MQPTNSDKMRSYMNKMPTSKCPYHYNSISTYTKSIFIYLLQYVSLGIHRSTWSYLKQPPFHHPQFQTIKVYQFKKWGFHSNNWTSTATKQHPRDHRNDRNDAPCSLRPRRWPAKGAAVKMTSMADHQVGPATTVPDVVNNGLIAELTNNGLTYWIMTIN